MTKWVNSVLLIIGVNSLKLEDIQVNLGDKILLIN